jgi:hypothetical protein
VRARRVTVDERRLPRRRTSTAAPARVNGGANERQLRIEGGPEWVQNVEIRAGRAVGSTFCTAWVQNVEMRAGRAVGSTFCAQGPQNIDRSDANRKISTFCGRLPTRRP